MQNLSMQIANGNEICAPIKTFVMVFLI